MKSILNLFIALLMVFFLNACGGGDSASFYTNDNNRIEIGDSIATATLIYEGDLIVKDDNNTVIGIVYDSNGNKKIYLISGSAHIVRNN